MLPSLPDRPLRAGVVGLRRGAALLRVLARQPGVEVAALCDLDATRLEAAASEYRAPGIYTDFDGFLGHGLDVVVIASPPALHVSQAIAALRAGAHVLSEVPAVTSLDEARMLAQAAREASSLYMLAENCCYWAFVQSWKQMVADGRIGEPVYAEAEYIHDCRSLLRDPDGTPTWRASLPPIHYCTHSLGPLLAVAGGRPVTAVGLHSGSRMNPDLGTFDMEVGLFRTDRGVPLKVLCGFGVARRPSFHSYTIYGTRGCLERPRPGTGPVETTIAYFEEVPHLHGMASLPLDTRHPDAPASAAAGGHGTAEWAMVRDFVEAIRGGRPSPIDVHAALDMTLPGLCAHRSALQGGVQVEIPDFR